ncbi:MAG: methyltransferase domain-containing protein [Bacteroidota bacterium]|nr:methyltransferase domain-containing protein [Bacteroidota bacterium]
MHLNSELIFKKYAKKYFQPFHKVLEIGPAGIPSVYNILLDIDSTVWHTLDFKNTSYIATESSNLTFEIEDPYKFTIEDNQYDIVVSGQVIEHVQEIWLWMTEIKRVLKQGGIVITINPISWPYHEAPIDCWRIYPEGMKSIAKLCGLEVVFCDYMSLEKSYLKEKYNVEHTIPGMSYTHAYTEKEFSRIISWNKNPLLNKLLKVPIQVSYDTISVLRKAD